MHKELSRLMSIFSIFVFFVASILTTVSCAATMPLVTDLQMQIKNPPQIFKVVEPHLSQKGRLIQVEYLGYPASQVFDLLFGPSWKDQDADIEFRALDGYVSRIEISRFKQYRAYFVFGIKDKTEFIADNLGQNEKSIPLGPYYLIWDNINAPQLVAEGAADWPYQVNQISISKTRKQALLPGALSQTYIEHSNLTQRHCLTCHQVNGYGGDKWAINLASHIKTMKENTFKLWVLNPGAQNPGTTMPPLLDAMPEAERQAIAEKIYQYLLALPVAIDSATK
jgi:mono/diheme cytochrome c family protein